MNRSREILKKVGRAILGDYSIYKIYSFDSHNQEQSPPNSKELKFTRISTQDLELSNHQLLVEQAWYLQTDSHAFAVKINNDIVAICVFWFGDTYKQRNFWPLQEKEAKLVQIITLPEMRGRKIAPKLIRFACSELQEQGFRRLYARIWHSNLPSIKAFLASGWREVATVIEIFPLGSKRPIKFTKRR